MKTTNIFLSLLLIATTASAKEKLTTIPNPVPQLPENFYQYAPAAPVQVPQIEILQKAAASKAKKAPAAAQDKAYEAGYLQPEGTLFLGLERQNYTPIWKNSGLYKQLGQGAYIDVCPGVVGAWSDTIPCWRWRNQIAKYKKMSYRTLFYANNEDYCEGAFYQVDKNGDFLDSIVPQNGFEETRGGVGDSYLFSGASYANISLPAQEVVYANSDTSRFMLFSSEESPRIYSDEELDVMAFKGDTIYNELYFTLGGQASGISADGLWPLTNAYSLVSRERVSTTMLNITPSDMPQALITYYEKPQAPLYVKNITLAVNANDDKPASIAFDNLKLEVISLVDSTTVLATATATTKNTENMARFKGKFILFEFNKQVSPYGEVLNEGFTVDEPFMVVISGMQAGDNLAVHCAKHLLGEKKTALQYADRTEKLDLDPYLMLNGNYTTLEDYFAIYYKKYGLSTEAHEDTIPIEMKSANSLYYKYIGTYAAKAYNNTEMFAFYSTYMPYDTLTRMWNFDIKRPEYIQLGADCEYEYETTDGKVTIWEWQQAFFFYIYATSTPVIGDCITLSKAGRKVVFKITKIDGTTAIDAMYGDATAGVQKKIENNRVVILKNNRRFTLTGEEIR